MVTKQEREDYERGVRDRDAAEMVAVDSGLGYLVIDSRNSGKRYDLVIAAMLIIGLIGLALDLGFRRLEKLRSVRWGFRHES